MYPIVFFALLAAFTGPAGADLLYEPNSNVKILLQTTPCQEPTLGQIKPEFREEFKKMEITLNGELHQGCWIVDLNDVGDAFIILDSGAAFGLELNRFTPVANDPDTDNV